MQRWEVMKNMTAEDAGEYICEIIDMTAGFETDACDTCPVRERCHVGHNGWVDMLKSKPEGWESKYYKKEAV